MDSITHHISTGSEPSEIPKTSKVLPYETIKSRSATPPAIKIKQELLPFESSRFTVSELLSVKESSPLISADETPPPKQPAYDLRQTKKRKHTSQRRSPKELTAKQKEEEKFMRLLREMIRYRKEKRARLQADILGSDCDTLGGIEDRAGSIFPDSPEIYTPPSISPRETKPQDTARPPWEIEYSSADIELQTTPFSIDDASLTPPKFLKRESFHSASTSSTNSLESIPEGTTMYAPTGKKNGLPAAADFQLRFEACAENLRRLFEDPDPPTDELEALPDIINGIMEEMNNGFSRDDIED